MCVVAEASINQKKKGREMMDIVENCCLCNVSPTSTSIILANREFVARCLFNVLRVESSNKRLLFMSHPGESLYLIPPVQGRIYIWFFKYEALIYVLSRGEFIFDYSHPRGSFYLIPPSKLVADPFGWYYICNEETLFYFHILRLQHGDK